LQRNCGFWDVTLYCWGAVSNVLKDLGATIFRVKHYKEECLPIDVFTARFGVLLVVLLKVFILLGCYSVSFGKQFHMFFRYCGSLKHQEQHMVTF
jgi:hypothetical protein